MSSSFRNTVARFIIAAYVLAGVLLEVAHHPHDIVPVTAPALTSHDCGAAEIHIPLDERSHCLACVHSSLRLATATGSTTVNTSFTSSPGPTFGVHERTLHPDLFHSGKRGPPQS